jgi:hypothetical protein
MYKMTISLKIVKVVFLSVAQLVTSGFFSQLEIIHVLSGQQPKTSTDVTPWTVKIRQNLGSGPWGPLPGTVQYLLQS